jgi:hypothetical protein
MAEGWEARLRDIRLRGGFRVAARYRGEEGTVATDGESGNGAAVVERSELHGREFWRSADGRWRVADWPGESYESRALVEHLLELERESSLLGLINRRIVQHGGRPVPTLPTPTRRT